MTLRLPAADLRLHRFVSVHRAMDFVRQGWLALPTLENTHHAEHRVHVVWLCCCERSEQAPDPKLARALARASIRASQQQQRDYARVAGRRGRR